jgi:modulator of FtsH protease
VFVAVSINIERILRYWGLPERALAAVVLLLGVLVTSLFGLAPGQGPTPLGLELLGTCLAVCATISFLLLRSRPRGRGADDDESHLASSLIVAAPGTLPFLIGAVSLLAGAGGGLYWVLAGMIGAVTGAIINAWILLVEILR